MQQQILFPVLFLYFDHIKEIVRNYNDKLSSEQSIYEIMHKKSLHQNRSGLYSILLKSTIMD